MHDRRSILGLAGALALLPTALRAQACTAAVTGEHLVTPGKWTMSINPTLPPQQFVDEKGELQGLNVELTREMARRMCLEPVYLRMDFPPMIPGLRAARFDTINTGMFWTDERSKLFWMVPYAQQAISVYTSPSSTLQIKAFEDLAGHTVGVESATYTERRAREAVVEFAAKGLKPVDFRTFSTASETSAALRAGQLDAALNIDETAKALVTRGIAKIWLSGLYGTDIALAFRDKPLADAAVAALTGMHKDGLYEPLFEKFGMTKLATPAFAIRGPGPAA